MLNRNNILTGTLIGLILPVIAGIFCELLFKNAGWLGDRPTPYLIVVAINLAMLRYFARKHQDKTVQGMMAVTFAFMILVFILKFHHS